MLLLAMMASAPALSAQDHYFVQSERADLFTRPVFGSSVVVRLSRGSRLTSAGIQGGWMKVRSGSREGFVPALLLAPLPPMDRLQVTAEQRPAQKYDFRRRSSAYAEPLRDEGRPAANHQASPEEPKTDYTALKKMESVTVGIDDIIYFMEKP